MSGPLHAIHHSMRGRVIRRVPRGMDSMSLPKDLHEAATRIALDVFTSAVNVGVPLQDALLAIYMTGLENAAALTAAQSGEGKEGGA